ncbi:MAG TPA: long-chain fatty acid--CoA ligase, partial [Sorangium sp.]|nr:long-chain fatty acid--CoA ligase [Sorangium sp.]
MPADTIVTRFFKQGELRPTAPAYYTKVGSRWKPTNWKTYNDEVRLAARALMALGVGEATGDKASCVCILGFNRPEWAVFDLAAMAAGGVPAGIYTTGSPPEVAYILEHTEATVVLVEDLGQWKKIEQERGGLPNLKHVVLMKDVAAVDDDMVLTWDDFNARSSEVSDDKLQQRIDALQPQQLATLIYTSGTTGPPKGVMLSHDNLAWTAQCAIDMIDTGAQDCVVSYLPLSHIAEQMFSLHVPATSGMQVYFAESIKKVADNFKEVRPTVLFAVPRIWEKFYAGVTTKMSQTTGIKAKIADWARDTGMEVSNLRNYGLEPSGWLAFKYDFFNKQVFSKIKAALGLDRARTCVSGAAPISTEIVKFFASLDIPIREVYGQSEDTGPTSFNLPGKTKFGTVGPPIAGVEVKIADDDEILVRGRNVFLGYYKNQAD